MPKSGVLFSLVASGPDPLADDFEARFRDAGCGDATVSLRNSWIIPDFSRVADSQGRAVSAATACVAAAGAKVGMAVPGGLSGLAGLPSRR